MTQVKVTIAKVAMNAIATMQNATNQEILNEVKKVFPNAKTSLNCIAWYKSDMKKNKYQVAKVEVERTIQVIEKELQDAMTLVEVLQQEFEDKKVATREQLLQEKARIEALLQE